LTTQVRTSEYKEITLKGIDSSTSSEALNYIQNVLVPPAINLLQAALKVVPLSAPITIKSNTVCSGKVDTPSIYKTEGVSADLVLFITTSNDPSTNYVASAVFCSLSQENGRPLVGRLNYNLYYFEPTTNDVNIESHVYTTIHEMIHALGFSSGLYSTYINPATNKRLTGHVRSKTVNGGQVQYINLPPLTKRLREHFNCPTLEGAYLENQGGSLSAGSHFERRIFFNEFMTGSGIRDVKITEFTLALLEGTGWYEVDYTYAEPITYGKNKGCDFLDTPCVDQTGKSAFPEFCSPLTSMQPYWTRRGVGVCGAQSVTTSASLLSRYNYWGDNTVVTDVYADNCPNVRIYINLDCEDSTLQTFATLGNKESYGFGSKGFTGTLNSGSFPLTSTFGYCFQPQCTLQSSGDYELKVKIGSSWVTCNKEGPVNAPSRSGVSGKLDCPDPNDFCNQIETEGNCRGGCFGKGSCVNKQCQCEDGWGFHDCIKKTYTDNCERCAGSDPWRTSCYGDTCECNPNNATCACELGLKTGSVCTGGDVGSGVDTGEVSFTASSGSSKKPTVFIIAGSAGGVVAVIALFFIVRFGRRISKTRAETAKVESYKEKDPGNSGDSGRQVQETITITINAKENPSIHDVDVESLNVAPSLNTEVDVDSQNRMMA